MCRPAFICKLRDIHNFLAYLKAALSVVPLAPQLSRQQAAALYAGHSGQPYFASLLAHIRSGPVLALALAGRDAVTKWREAIGPTDPAQARATAPRRCAETGRPWCILRGYAHFAFSLLD